METNLDNTESQDVITRLLRHRGKIAITFLVVLVATGFVTSLSERQYESEAKLQVQVGRESVALDPTATIGAFVGVADSRETEIQAIEELILSKNVLGKVVDKIGVNQLLGSEKWYAAGQLKWLDDNNLNPLRVYDRHAKAIKKLQTNFKLDIPRNSKIITMRYETDSPEMAKQVVQNMIEVAIDEHLNVNRQEETLQFFEGESKRLHEKVMSLENELAAEKLATGISSTEHQRRLYIEQISKYKDEIGHLSARGYALKKEVALRKIQVANLSKMLTKQEVSGSANNPEYEMRVELFKLELREKELTAKYSDDNDQLKQVREQVKLARETLNNQAATREVTQGNNEERGRYEVALLEREAELVEGEARQEQLKVDLTALQESLADLDNKSKRINNLERELALADLSYRKYNESVEVARIDQQRFKGRLSNIRSLQEPTFSTQPTSPKVMFNFVLGFFSAGIASLGIVALAERGRKVVQETAVAREIALPNPSAEVSRIARRESLSVHTP